MISYQWLQIVDRDQGQKKKKKVSAAMAMVDAHVPLNTSCWDMFKSVTPNLSMCRHLLE